MSELSLECRSVCQNQDKPIRIESLQGIFTFFNSIDEDHSAYLEGAELNEDLLKLDDDKDGRVDMVEFAGSECLKMEDSYRRAYKRALSSAYERFETASLDYYDDKLSRLEAVASIIDSGSYVPTAPSLHRGMEQVIGADFVLKLGEFGAFQPQADGGFLLSYYLGYRSDGASFGWNTDFIYTSERACLNAPPHIATDNDTLLPLEAAARRLTLFTGANLNYDILDDSLRLFVKMNVGAEYITPHDVRNKISGETEYSVDGYFSLTGLIGAGLGFRLDKIDRDTWFVVAYGANICDDFFLLDGLSIVHQLQLGLRYRI